MKWVLLIIFLGPEPQVQTVPYPSLNSCEEALLAGRIDAGEGAAVVAVCSIGGEA